MDLAVLFHQGPTLKGLRDDCDNIVPSAPLTRPGMTGMLGAIVQHLEVFWVKSLPKYFFDVSNL